MTPGTALFTLAGVAVGGVVSFVVTTFTERARWRRDRNERWSTTRLEAYRAFMNAMHAQVGAARSLATTQGLLEGPPPVEVEVGIREISESDRDLALAYETVQLLGDESTGAAAHAWRFAVWRLSDYARGLIPAGPDAWATAYTEYRRLRDDFQVAVRRDLGIEGNGFLRLNAQHWTSESTSPDADGDSRHYSNPSSSDSPT